MAGCLCSSNCPAGVALQATAAPFGASRRLSSCTAISSEALGGSSGPLPDGLDQPDERLEGVLDHKHCHTHQHLKQ